MRVALLLLVPCLALRFIHAVNDQHHERFEEAGVVQEDDESSAASVGAIASSGNVSSASRVPVGGAKGLPGSPPQLEYLQSESGEDYLLEVTYLNHRITFPEELREESTPPYERFREEFEQFQSSFPDSGDIAAKRNDTPVIFLHIHKYGGTSVCLLAKLNNERIPPGDCNCNFCQDSCRYYQPSRMHPGEYGNAMIPHTSVSYAQIERDLSPQELDTFLSMKARTGVMLREPMEGALANIVAHKIAVSDLETALKVDDFLRAYPHSPGCFKQAYAPGVVGLLLQSSATRALSGFFGRTSTTDEHLEQAKRNLDKFDVVEILEDINITNFANKFGWNADLSLAKKNSVGSNGKNHLREMLEMYGLWDRLRKANEHDMKLYEYARDKFR
jgi:hypothetical protein